MTTKIWSLFQYPPKPELAAAASLPLLILTVMLLRAENMILAAAPTRAGGKNSERACSGRLSALGALGSVSSAAQPRVPALRRAANATFSKSPRSSFVQHFSFHNIISCSSSCRHQVALYNTSCSASPPRPSARSSPCDLLSHHARGGDRAQGARLPRHRSGFAIPGIVLGVGLFLSYTRRRSCSTARCGILFFAAGLPGPLPCRRLSADAVGFKAIHRELETHRILGATRLRALWQITAPLLPPR